MSRAAMQQALAYIEEVDYGPYDKWPVIIALKQALAEPEQEPDGISWLKRDSGYFTAPTPQFEQRPVAWAEEIIEDLHALYDTEMIRENDSGDALIRLDDAIACVEDAKQHYTAPTPRKPLTDEEIDRVTDQQWAQNNHKPIYAAHRAYARAIERAHGIGESK